jgi:zinc transporter 1/2/3
MAGLIAMIAVFFVVSVEMFFSTMNGGPTGGCHGSAGVGYEILTPTRSSFSHRRRGSSASSASLMNGGNSTLGDVVRPVRRTQRSGSIGRQLTRIELGASNLEFPEAISDESSDASHKSDDEDDADSDVGERTTLRSVNSRKRSMSSSRERRHHDHGDGRLTEEQQQKKHLLQVMLLEAGILFHSVFIGMSLFHSQPTVD